MSNVIDSMPAGYNLQACDDCGIVGLQPHVRSPYVYEFPEASVSADRRARTVANGAPNFDMAYEGLDSTASYILAITYASEKGNKRVQSLSAGSVQVHGPYMLPDGSSERLLFKIPSGAIQDGKLVLHFTLNEGPNAVVSVVELWAPIPSPKALYLALAPDINGALAGSVFNLAQEPVPGTGVEIRDSATGAAHGTVATGADGSFRFDVTGWVKPGSTGIAEIIAKSDGIEAKGSAPFSTLSFLPPHYVPIPEEVAGLRMPVVKLDGIWRINPSPSADFQTQSTKGAGWADFTVPGQWLQQGFDVPRDRSVGVATDFDIPASWKGKRIVLRFDAVHGGTDYWLNGHHLGYSENLFTPVEFDITDAALIGKTNHLALTMKVDTPSESLSWSSNYAFHNLGGIDRSVRIMALPPVHLSELHLETDLDKEYRDATLILKLGLSNSTDAAAEGLSMRVSLQAPDGSDVILAGSGSTLDPLQPGETQVTRKFFVRDPLRWNAEKPHLYKLMVGLYRSGALVEQVQQNVGFRKIEVKGSALLVNGRRVKLAGACRHEVDPLTGRAATARHAEEYVRLAKDANFNFIRTSHYPPTREFLDACDRLGMYVEVEGPFCWVRGRGEDDPSLAAAFLTPAAAMLDYNRNHPSIIMWSLGNESGSVPDGANKLPANFERERQFIHKQDPSRPTIFNNEWAKDGGACEIACLHYPPFPPEQYEYVKDDHRPIFLDEYTLPQSFIVQEEADLNPGLDTIFGSSGQNAPNSVWNQLYYSDRTLGGSIWAAGDEEFYLKDGTKGYGTWGFYDVWCRHKSLFWDDQRIYSPVWIPIRRLDYKPGAQTLRIPVENRYSFTDLSELKITWEVAGKKGRCKTALAPESKGELEVRISDGMPEGSLLVLRFNEPGGRLVTACGVTLGDVPPVKVPAPTAGCPAWRDDGRSITVDGKGFHFVLDKATGDVTGSKLLRFPRLHAARRQSKNVFNPGGTEFALYPDDSTRQVDSVTAEQKGDALAIRVSDYYKDYHGYVEMLLDKEGRADVSFHYTYSGEPFDVSEIGLRFLMDSGCQEIRWKRKTEWDVYPDDHIGRPEGHAQAHMGKEWGNVGFTPYHSKPKWPWYLDENQWGTRDFRATKYNIYQAQLVTPDGSGIRADSDATTDVRACLDQGGVLFNALLSSPPAKVNTNDELSGKFSIALVQGEP